MGYGKSVLVLLFSVILGSNIGDLLKGVLSRRSGDDDDSEERSLVTFEIPGFSEDREYSEITVEKDYRIRKIGYNKPDNQLTFGNSIFLSRKNVRDHFSVMTLTPNSTTDLEMYPENGASVLQLAEKYNCVIASNAGFFDMASLDHYGNLVSNGTLVKIDREITKRNVNFGISTDGKYHVGYFDFENLTDEEIMEEFKFKELITGIFWLVKEGKSYMRQAAQFEKIKESSEYDVSSRLAIGHDINGNLMITQVNGKTWTNGLNMYDFTQLLVDQGFYNAINLDGGGSTTIVSNNAIISQLSDYCDKNNNKIDRCYRKLKTILCVSNRNLEDKKNDHKCDEDGFREQMGPDVGKLQVAEFFLVILILGFIFSFVLNLYFVVVRYYVSRKKRRKETVDYSLLKGVDIELQESESTSENGEIESSVKRNSNGTTASFF